MTPESKRQEPHEIECIDVSRVIRTTTARSKLTSDAKKEDDKGDTITAEGSDHILDHGNTILSLLEVHGAFVISSRGTLAVWVIVFVVIRDGRRLLLKVLLQHLMLGADLVLRLLRLGHDVVTLLLGSHMGMKERGTMKG